MVGALSALFSFSPRTAAARLSEHAEHQTTPFNFPRLSDPALARRGERKLRSHRFRPNTVRSRPPSTSFNLASSFFPRHPELTPLRGRGRGRGPKPLQSTAGQDQAPVRNRYFTRVAAWWPAARAAQVGWRWQYRTLRALCGRVSRPQAQPPPYHRASAPATKIKH